MLALIRHTCRRFHCPRWETNSPVVLLDNMCLLFPWVDWILDGPFWNFFFLHKSCIFFVLFHRQHMYMHCRVWVRSCLASSSNVCCSPPSQSTALCLHFIGKCLQMRFGLPINPPLWKVDSVYHPRRHPLASSTITVTALNEWYHSWPRSSFGEDASQEDVVHATLKKQLLK